MFLIMKKIFKISLLCLSLFFITISQVKALTIWNYEDWKDGINYGSKVKISDNITNLKGEIKETDGMKVGPFNKASKAKLSDGITEEVYVGLDKDNYKNSELFELSIALNKQESNKESEYLTEAVVMTQKSNDKFVLTSSWAKDKNPIATIDENGVYTYKWEFKKNNNNKIEVKFTVLNYGTELGTTGFVDLNVDASKATDVRYLWACNIKSEYGVDIYTTLPKRESELVENPGTSDINLLLLVGLITVSGVGLILIKKIKIY